MEVFLLSQSWMITVSFVSSKLQLCIGVYYLFFQLAIFLVYNMSSYTFHETDGTVDDVIRVQKRIGSPPTEVDIPLIIVTTNESGSATAGDGS